MKAPCPRCANLLGIRCQCLLIDRSLAAKVKIVVETLSMCQAGKTAAFHKRVAMSRDISELT